MNQLSLVKDWKIAGLLVTIFLFVSGGQEVQAQFLQGKNCGPRPTWDCDPEFPYDPLNGAIMPTGRGIGGATYLQWNFPSSVDGLNFLITFHTAPKGPEAAFLQLYESDIGDAHQYFGFQYQYVGGKLKTGFIWSRWGLKGCSAQDEIEARKLVIPGPYIDRNDLPTVAFGKHDGEPYCAPWVGIRFPFKWSKGHYYVRLTKESTKGLNDWYQLQIYNYQTKTWAYVGKIAFPNNNGRRGIKPSGGSWAEVWGGVSSSAQISYFHYSLETSGFREGADSSFPPNSVQIKYGAEVYGIDGVPNSDASLDPNGKRLHVRFGEQTRRRQGSQLIPIYLRP